MYAREAMRRIRALSIRGAVQIAFENTKDQYLRLQREQMRAGKQSTGDDIQLSPLAWFPGYSEGYKRRREREGLEVEFVDLNRTGAFQEEFQLTIEGETITITSEVDYERWITKRFGKKIWGLGGKWLQEYKEKYFQPALALAIQEQSGLNLARK